MKRHWVYRAFPFIADYAVILRKIYKKIKNSAAFLFFLVTTPLFIVLKILNYETINLNYTRIGHLLSDFDFYLKESLNSNNKKTPLLFCNKNEFANRHVIKHYDKKIVIIHIPIKNSFYFCRLLNSHPLTLKNLSKYNETENQRSFLIYREWGDQKPIFSREKHTIVSNELSELAGKNVERWVCLHYRTSNYSDFYQRGYKSRVDPGQAFRNSNPNNLKAVVKELSRLGIYSVIMGHDREIHFSDEKFVINFSSASWRTEKLDIDLSSNCVFYVGNSSGAIAIPRVFGVPVAGTNITPFLHSLGGAYRDINIHKWYWSDSKKRILNYREMLSENILMMRESRHFIDNKIELIENSEEENLCLLYDMLEQHQLIDVSKNYDDEIYASKLFEEILSSSLQKRYYWENKISKKFLLKNINLLN